MSHTDTDTDTQPEEAPVWEMPDFTTSPDAIDEMFAELDEEEAACGAAILRQLASWRAEIDYLTTVRDHS